MVHRQKQATVAHHNKNQILVRGETKKVNECTGREAGVCVKLLLLLAIRILLGLYFCILGCLLLGVGCWIKRLVVSATNNLTTR